MRVGVFGAGALELTPMNEIPRKSQAPRNRPRVSSTFSYGRIYVSFAVLAIVLAALMYQDLRPRPIFPVIRPTGEPVSEAFLLGESVRFEFDAPGRNLSGFYFPDLVWNERHQVEIGVENLTSGKTVAQQLLTIESPQPNFIAANAAGDRLRVELRWKLDAPPVLEPTFRTHSGSNLFEIERPETPTLERGKPVSFSFVAPSANLDAFALPGLLDDPATRVKIEIVNLTTGATLKRFTASDGAAAQRSFKPANAKGDQIQVTLEWQKSPPPALLSSVIPARITIDGIQPTVRANYTSPMRWLHLLWIPAGLLAVAAFRNRRFVPLALTGLGVAATATSILSWQQTYSLVDNHFDPDRFSEFGQMLAEWVRNPESRELTELFLSGWRYSWLPLTPMLTGFQQLLGVPAALASVIVSALASFGSVLLLHALLRRAFGLSELSAFAGAVLFLTHHFVLMSFAKPSTDPVGLTLVIASLFLVAERLRKPANLSQIIWLAVIVFLHFFARPPGFLFAAFTVGCAILADWLRLRRLDLLGGLRTGAVIGVAPVLVVLGCFVAFGWFDNFDAALHSSNHFHHQSTLGKFGETGLSMIQLLPILWLFAGRDRLRKPEAWLLLAWAGFYLALIVYIQAAYISRLFLPMLAPSIVFAVLGLDRLRITGWIIFVLTVFLNIAVIVHYSLLVASPSGWISRLISPLMRCDSFAKSHVGFLHSFYAPFEWV